MKQIIGVVCLILGILCSRWIKSIGKFNEGNNAFIYVNTIALMMILLALGILLLARVL